MDIIRIIYMNWYEFTSIYQAKNYEKLKQLFYTADFSASF